MREIFGPGEQPDPGQVFYTITLADVGERVIPTEIGPVNVGSFMGPVQKQDVGKRIIRRRVSIGADRDSDVYIWQVENDAQRDRRMSG